MAIRGGPRRFHIRILPTILLTAAILLLPALLYAYGRQDDSFEVRRVKVSGTKRIAEKDALRLLRAEYLGTNLFTVTRQDVRTTLDKLPYLAGVVIDRQFPTTLRVRVVEYKPAAYVLARDYWYVVSDTGHVIDRVGTKETTLTAAVEQQEPSPGDTGTTTATSPSATASASPAATASPSSSATLAASASAPATPASSSSTATATPASSGAAVSDPAAVAAALDRGPRGVKLKLPRIAATTKLKPGGEVRDEDLLAALGVVVGLPDSLRARVAVVDVQPGRQVGLSFTDDLEVEIGDTHRLVAKVLALRAVLKAYEARGEHATFVDVSIPDRPLGRPRLTS